MLDVPLRVLLFDSSIEQWSPCSAAASRRSVMSTLGKYSMQFSSNIAFKEWAVVCAALASGRQTIILRKGGIDEGREGFRVKHGEFWLLPTRFHQDVAALVPDAEPLLRESQQHKPPPGRFQIELYAVVEEIFEVRELELLERLVSLHILSKQTIEQRFYYRHPGLFVLAARIYRTSAVFEIDDNPYIAGCKSWVELPQPQPTVGAIPVVDDAAFAAQIAAIRQLVA
jgi:hypothetical protein